VTCKQESGAVIPVGSFIRGVSLGLGRLEDDLSRKGGEDQCYSDLFTNHSTAIWLFKLEALGLRPVSEVSDRSRAILLSIRPQALHQVRLPIVSLRKHPIVGMASPAWSALPCR